jgi:hypothetical protein
VWLYAPELALFADQLHALAALDRTEAMLERIEAKFGATITRVGDGGELLAFVREPAPGRASHGEAMLRLERIHVDAHAIRRARDEFRSLSQAFPTRGT